MKTFEVRVTNTEDANDVATFEINRTDESDTADTVIDLVGRGMTGEIAFNCGTKYVVIFEASDGEGFIYDVYASKKAYEEHEHSEEGGQCTGTLSDAISMAIN